MLPILLTLLAASPCSSDLSSDPKNCGECANACSFDNATPVCSGGHCKLGACSVSFGDCDEDPGTGCEASLSSDPANCGACGHSCGGAACRAGVCGSLATAIAHPTGWTPVATDGTFAYWYDAGALWSSPLGAPAPKKLLPGFSDVRALAASKEVFFLTTDGDQRLLSVLAVNGTTSELWHGSSISSLIADEAGAAFLGRRRASQYDPEQTSVYTASRDGKINLIAAPPPEQVCSIAMDAANVYLFTKGYLYRYPRSGGAGVLLATLVPYRGCGWIAAVGDRLYFTEAIEGPPHHFRYPILSVPVAGGPVTQVAERDNSPENFVSDSAGHLVWSESHKPPGSFYDRTDIWRVGPSGKPERLVADQDGQLQLAAAKGHVVWFHTAQLRTVKNPDGGTRDVYAPIEYTVFDLAP